jgi:hypothetical protein
MFWPFFNSLLGGTAGPDFQSGPDDDQWFFLCLFVCLFVSSYAKNVNAIEKMSRSDYDLLVQLKVGEMPTVFFFQRVLSLIIWK